MPELPEVETVARELWESGIGKFCFSRIDVRFRKTIGGVRPEEFEGILESQRVSRVWRRAKYMIWNLSGGSSLLIHLRMTGQFGWAEDEEASPHEHVSFFFEDGRELRFKDTRKFGRILLVQDAEKALGHLGPEPLESGFTPKWLWENLKKRSTKIKPLLLNQEFLAGLGNIYVDEALFEAGIHPLRPADQIRKKEAEDLHSAIVVVLNRGLRNLGTSLGTGAANFYSVNGRAGRNQDQLRVFRRTGEPCYLCSQPIQRLLVAQRSTHVCLKCQK